MYDPSIYSGIKNKMNHGLSIEQHQGPTPETPISNPNKRFKEFDQSQYLSGDSFIAKNNN